MFHSEDYMRQLIDLLKGSFHDRLCYVGLQGSYMRGEATEDSDIDPMVVIDRLTVADLDSYKQIISHMECPEKSCGFICGKQDLMCWNPLEICHLLHTTKDYYGKLAELVPTYTDDDVRNFVRLSVNNLYHEITHRYIHGSPDENAARIASSYKGVFFILQNVHYLETGVFVQGKAELLERLEDEDREILTVAIAVGNGESFDFDTIFSVLHIWCRNVLKRLANWGNKDEVQN